MEGPPSRTDSVNPTRLQGKAPSASQEDRVGKQLMGARGFPSSNALHAPHHLVGKQLSPGPGRQSSELTQPWPSELWARIKKRWREALAAQALGAASLPGVILPPTLLEGKPSSHSHGRGQALRSRPAPWAPW